MVLIEPHVQRALGDGGVCDVGAGRRVSELDEARVGRQRVLRRFELLDVLVTRNPYDGAVDTGLARSESGRYASRLLGSLSDLDAAHHPAREISGRAHR